MRRPRSGLAQAPQECEIGFEPAAIRKMSARQGGGWCCSVRARERPPVSRQEERAGPGRLVLAFVSALGLCVGFVLLPTAASAGAWTLPEGTGQVDFTLTATSADHAFDGATLASTPRYDKFDPQAWIEYGVTDAFTAILAPSLQQVDIGSPIDAQRTGLGHTELGGRYRLFQNNSWVFSGQATLAAPGTFDNANPAAVGYTDFEPTSEASLVTVFRSKAYRPSSIWSSPNDSLRRSAQRVPRRLTFGVAAVETMAFLAQSFNVVSEGSGRPPFTSYEYYKFQLSAVYALTPTVSLQFGGVTTYAGSNSLQENGIVAGVWSKF